MSGALIFVVALVRRGAGAGVRGREDRVAGHQLDHRAVRPLHAHPAAGPASHRAVHGHGRPQDEHAGERPRHSAAEGHHQGQRQRPGRRRRLLPGDRRGAGGLRGAEPPPRHHQPGADQHPQRHGQHGARRGAVQAQRHQQHAAGGDRPGDQPVGRQGAAHRGQGHRAARGHRGRDGPADEGRAREARHHPRVRGRARDRASSAPRARSSRPS